MKRVIVFLLCIAMMLPLTNANAASLPALQQVATLNGVSSTITSADYSKDDLFIATGDATGQVSIWNASTGRLISSWSACVCEGVLHVTYSPDNKLIATADTYGNVKLWDTTTGKLLQTLSKTKEEEGQPINDLLFNAAGTMIYTANVDHHSVTLWNISKGTHEEFSFISEPLSLAYNGVTQELAVGLANGNVNIRNAETGAYKMEITDGVKHSIVKVRYVTDHRHLFGISSQSNQPFILDGQYGYEPVLLEEGQFEIKPQQSKWNAFSFSSDGKYVAAVSSAYDETYKTLTVFDMTSKEGMATVFAGENPNVVAFSHNNKRIFAGTTIFDATTLPNYQYSGIQAVVQSDVIRVGEPLQLSAIALYKDGRQKTLDAQTYKVTSSNPEVVTMKYGKLLALKEGTTTITIDYGAYRASVKVYVNEYKELGEKIEPANKVWTVKFNASVDMKSINENTLSITNEAGNKVKLTYALKAGSTTEVTLKPEKSFTVGETYTIWVKDVKSKSGKSITQFTTMDFQVK